MESTILIEIFLGIAPFHNDWREIPIQTINYRDYAKYQVSPAEWICLDELWEKESSWQTKPRPHLAVNRSSGAYGIPQALPANKMESAGHDWKHNPITQIKWGLGYIKERYGSACQALAHHKKKGWY